PMAAVAPILVFVGVSMVATAFQANAKRYYPAVALAMLPYIGNFFMTRLKGQADLLNPISTGIIPLGQGAMFTAMMIGAMTVCVIDQQFRRATVFALISAAMAYTGLIHAPKLAWNAAPEFALGYFILALMF